MTTYLTFFISLRLIGFCRVTWIQLIFIMLSEKGELKIRFTKFEVLMAHGLRTITYSSRKRENILEISLIPITSTRSGTYTISWLTLISPLFPMRLWLFSLHRSRWMRSNRRFFSWNRTKLRGLMGSLRLSFTGTGT